jgi:hypothetical protein
VKVEPIDPPVSVPPIPTRASARLSARLSHVHVQTPIPSKKTNRKGRKRKTRT